MYFEEAPKRDLKDFYDYRKYKKIRQNVEGPITREGIQCWKVTISTEDGQHKIIQYIKTKTGEVIETVHE